MRIRTIRPAFYVDEASGTLPLIWREFFRSLISLCDDHGVAPSSSIEIRATLFPGTSPTGLEGYPGIEGSVQEGTIEFIKAGLSYLEAHKKPSGNALIWMWEQKGKGWLLIPTFRKHQYVKGAKDNSTNPRPPGWELMDDVWVQTKDFLELEEDVMREITKFGPVTNKK